jgi:hypothetical protein
LPAWSGTDLNDEAGLVSAGLSDERDSACALNLRVSAAAADFASGFTRPELSEHET